MFRILITPVRCLALANTRISAADFLFLWELRAAKGVVLYDLQLTTGDNYMIGFPNKYCRNMFTFSIRSSIFETLSTWHRFIRTACYYYNNKTACKAGRQKIFIKPIIVLFFTFMNTKSRWSEKFSFCVLKRIYSEKAEIVRNKTWGALDFFILKMTYLCNRYWIYTSVCCKNELHKDILAPFTIVCWLNE